ncbi:MCE family protein [Nocardioides stalactiti]|uniref:MCE family protein n=1 Tax=Nocardioides stalactiti TaxID=2755356 RepID=UPI0016044046|nr:MCE family protein [Nocardioides stalactiti]
MAGFLALTLGSTAILVSTIVGGKPSDAVSYRAVFVDATRVMAGDEVRMAGVRVGRVQEVLLDPEQRAVVKFTVEGDLELPSSIRAVLRYRDLVGARYLSLVVKPGASTDELLEPGGVIPLSRTTAALDLTVLLDGFQPLFNVLEPDQVNQLALKVVRTLQGEGGTVASLVASTADVTAGLARRDDLIGRVIDNLNLVLDTVGERGTGLIALINQLRQLSSGLAEDRYIIAGALDSIAEFSTSAAALVEESRPALTKDIDSLRTAATAFAETKTQLQDLVDRLPIKLNAFTRAGSYGGYLNFFVCQLDITLTLPGIRPITAPGLRNNEALCES